MTKWRMYRIYKINIFKLCAKICKKFNEYNSGGKGKQQNKAKNDELEERQTVHKIIVILHPYTYVQIEKEQYILYNININIYI